MKSKVVVFDLDGTLHYTEKALVPAIQMAMEDLGYKPAHPDAINALYGEPLELFSSELLKCDENTCSEFRNAIRRHQKITVPEKGELYPGTGNMLRELKEMGFRLAICSNAHMDYIELVTGSLEIADMFFSFEGKDDNASKTARLGKIIEESGSIFTVMVGDRYHDIEAAVENRVPSIGCLYGYGKPGEMKRADYTVQTPVEIISAVRSLQSKIPG